MAHSGFFARQRELAGEFRLVMIDLRGHGRSEGGSAGATLAKLAEDVAALADALGLEDSVGIGWSLGASVLWKILTGPAGSRFAGTVVVDMTPRVLNDGGWTLGLSAEACEARTAAIREDFAAFARNAGQAIFAQPVEPALRPLADWAGEEFARNDPAAIDALWSSLVAEDLRGALGAIRQPTLVIHGARSQLYGSDTADYLVGALPDARALSFERSGHAPQLEQPELFNRTIREFAAGLPRVRQQQTTAF